MIDLKQIYESLICEGGASGHMSHIFEDPDLKFSDLKKIFTGLFKGKLAVEEKTDGQNLAVTMKNGIVGAARNKKSLENPMPVEDIEKMFEGKAEVKDAFVKSMKEVLQMPIEYKHSVLAPSSKEWVQYPSFKSGFSLKKLIQPNVELTKSNCLI